MDRFFPEVTEYSINGRYGSTEERYSFQYPFVKDYLELKLSKRSVFNFFIDRGRKEKICLYAKTDFAKWILMDLENSGCVEKNAITCVCDKDYGNLKQFYGYDIIGQDKLEEMYKSGEIKTIIVSSVFYENEIFRELMEKGIRQEDIFSIRDIFS